VRAAARVDYRKLGDAGGAAAAALGGDDDK
jgi:hypothetical protein